MSASKRYWILLPLLLIFIASTTQAQEVIKPLKKLQLSEKTPADQVPVWTGVAVDSKLRAYVGGDDHKIRLWNLQTGEIEKKLARNIDWIKAVLHFSNVDAMQVTVDALTKEMERWRKEDEA